MLEKQFEELITLASHRQLRLRETKQLHEFNRECDEVAKWIEDKEKVACSEETGKDLEHVEVLKIILYSTSMSPYCQICTFTCYVHI